MWSDLWLGDYFGSCVEDGLEKENRSRMISEEEAVEVVQTKDNEGLS